MHDQSTRLNYDVFVTAFYCLGSGNPESLLNNVMCILVNCRTPLSFPYLTEKKNVWLHLLTGGGWGGEGGFCLF